MNRAVPIILAILISAAVFGGVGYWLGTQKAEKAASTATATVTTTAKTSGTATADVTADWKTFTNNRYGYTIKYPSNWYVQSDSSESDFSQRGGADVGITYIGGDTAWSNYSKFDYTLGDLPEDRQVVSLLVHKTEQSLDDYFDAVYNVSANEISGKSTSKISGKDILKFTATSVSDHPVGAVGLMALVKVNNGIMSFSYTVNKTSDQSAIFNSMISTLIFTK